VDMELKCPRFGSCHLQISHHSLFVSIGSARYRVVNCNYAIRPFSPGSGSGNLGKEIGMCVLLLPDR
jgi:hypothetical protein